MTLYAHTVNLGRRHSGLLLLVGSFPSHLVSRHLPVSFETFLSMTPSSLFLSCPIPQTSLLRGPGPAPRPLSLVLPGNCMAVSRSGALHDSQRSVSANASGSRVVWYAHVLLWSCFPLVSLTFDKVTSCSCRALSEMLPFLPFSTVRLILKIMKFYATFVLSYRWKPKVFLPNCQEFYRP